MALPQVGNAAFYSSQEVTDSLYRAFPALASEEPFQSSPDNL